MDQRRNPYKLYHYPKRYTTFYGQEVLTTDKAKSAWRSARFATKTLICIAVFLVLFTAVQIWSFVYTGGEEQSQLIDSVFTVVGLECGGLLLKRIAEKIFSRNEKEDNGRDI